MVFVTYVTGAVMIFGWSEVRKLLNLESWAFKQNWAILKFSKIGKLCNF